MTRRNTRGAATAAPDVALRAPDVTSGPLMAQAATQHRAAPAVRAALLAETRQAEQGDGGSAGATPAAVAPAPLVQTRAAAPVAVRTVDPVEPAARMDGEEAATTTESTVTVTSATATPVDGGGFDVSMVLELRSQADAMGVAAEAEAAMRARGATVASVQAAILRAASARNAETVRGVAPAGSAARVVVDGGERFRQRAADAILLRARQASAVPDARHDAAAEFRGMRFDRLSEEILRARGVSVAGMEPHEIISRALAIGDLPAILGDAFNRVLADPPAPAERTFTLFSREVSATDFRTRNPVSLGQFAALRETPEGAPARFATTRDERQSYVMRNFEDIVGITFQALVNDDLGAFDSLPAQLENAAALMESSTFYTSLFSGTGPVMSDGNPLYHSSRNNIAATAAAPSVATLSAFRTMLRKQVDPNSVRMNLPLRYLVLPSMYETTVDQLFAGLVAGMNVARADVVAGNLATVVPVIEPILDDLSATAWYGVTNPAFGTFEHAYLAGNGFTLEQMGPQAVSGVFWKARRPFGCGVANPRGMVRNAGA